MVQARGLTPVQHLVLVLAVVAGVGAVPGLAGAEGDPSAMTVTIAGQWRVAASAPLAPFWLRLHPTDPARGGHRLMELVRPSPKPGLGDCPFLLVDPVGRLMAWEDRTTGTRLDRTAEGYAGVVEVPAADATALPLEQPVESPGPAQWESTTAPLLLAAVWRAGSRQRLPLLSVFGQAVVGTVAEAGTLDWDDGAVDLAGRSLVITGDSTGRLQRLASPDGSVLVVVDHRVERP